MNLVTRHKKNDGFALVELLVVLAIFGMLTGMVLSSLGETQRISAIARAESEMNQNLQDALGLMTAEMRFIGFPPSNYYDLSYLAAPSSPKNLVAKGLVAIGSDFIKFEGDINGDRIVDYVHYFLGAGAPYSLSRFSGSMNSDGTLPGGSPQRLAEQVESLQFRYFDRSGVETSSLPDVASIEVRLTLRTKNPDPATGLYRTVDETTRIHPQNL